jgi:aryl-alcohol dehydrogenase-like predicted oxidoreductase
MRYRLLGSAGCVVSSLALGAMTFGRDIGEADAHALLDRFADAGGSLLDTADVYGERSPGVPGDRSEEIIGSWLASRPREVTDRIVLATKGRFPTDDSPNGVGLSARHLNRAVDASLRRLGVDAIDLYQAHAFDPYTPLAETLRVMDGFVRAGKIRYYGLSNFLGWQLTEAVHLARELGVAPPVTLQVQYNLLARDVEWEVLPAARHAGLGLLPWSPLAGGWLTGKYQRNEPPRAGTRFAVDPMRGMQSFDERKAWSRTWAVLDALDKVASRNGTSPGPVALAWLDRQPGVSSVILGVRTAGQLDDNLGSLDISLSDDDLKVLDEASKPLSADYPYGAMGTKQRTRTISGGR